MINRDMNKKPMKIGSVNVNGLASKEKLIKLHQYFIAEEIDLLLIQEVRNIWSIEKMINIEIRIYLLHREQWRIFKWSWGDV